MASAFHSCGMQRLTYTFLFTLITLCACNPDNKYVKNHRWKYGKGLWIKNDVLHFNSMHLYLRNDTIFEFGTPLAVITQTVEAVAGFNELHIRSVKTNETGIYYDMGPVK